MFNVQAATSAELVAFYNANSGNPVIKKFADRATAEKRVNALIEKLAAEKAVEVEAEEESTAVAVVEVAATAEVEEEVSSDDEETAEEEAARLEAEAAADTAGPVQTAARKVTARRSNSEGVSASWADPAVKAARLIRDGVSVTVNGTTTTHRSTREGFRAYRLPDSMHIRFRLKLKDAKVADFTYNEVTYTFAII